MIKYSKFFTPWTALFFIILKVFVASDVSSTGIKRQDGVKLTNRLLESVHGVGFIMCIRECQTREDCFSVSYSRSHLICDLHRSSVRKENDASLVSDDPLFTYVDMADVASSPLSSCSSTGSCGSLATKCVQLSSQKTVCVNPVPRPSIKTSTPLSASSIVQSTTSVSTATDSSSISTTPNSSFCPAPFIESDDGKLCISIMQNKMSRDNAKSECQKTSNCLLLRIDSEEAQNIISAFLTKHMNSNVGNMWIDGTYENSKWTLSSGEMVYTNWKSKRSPKAGEDCILLMSDNSKWDPTLCSAKNSFLCEIKIT